MSEKKRHFLKIGCKRSNLSENVGLPKKGVPKEPDTLKSRTFLESVRHATNSLLFRAMVSLGSFAPELGVAHADTDTVTPGLPGVILKEKDGVREITQGDVGKRVKADCKKPCKKDGSRERLPGPKPRPRPEPTPEPRPILQDNTTFSLETPHTPHTIYVTIEGGANYPLHGQPGQVEFTDNTGVATYEVTGPHRVIIVQRAKISVINTAETGAKTARWEPDSTKNNGLSYTVSIDGKNPFAQTVPFNVLSTVGINLESVRIADNGTATAHTNVISLDEDKAINVPAGHTMRLVVKPNDVPNDNAFPRQFRIISADGQPELHYVMPPDAKAALQLPFDGSRMPDNFSLGVKVRYSPGFDKDNKDNDANVCNYKLYMDEDDEDGRVEIPLGTWAGINCVPSAQLKDTNDEHVTVTVQSGSPDTRYNGFTLVNGPNAQTNNPATATVNAERRSLATKWETNSFHPNRCADGCTQEFTRISPPIDTSRGNMIEFVANVEFHAQDRARSWSDTEETSLPGVRKVTVKREAGIALGYNTPKNLRCAGYGYEDAMICVYHDNAGNEMRKHTCAVSVDKRDADKDMYFRAKCGADLFDVAE